LDLRFVDKPDQYIGERLSSGSPRSASAERGAEPPRACSRTSRRPWPPRHGKSLAEGKVLQGKVTGVRDFGVFVDSGGVEGLVPVSELSHVRVGHPSEVVNVGDTVEVEGAPPRAAESAFAGQGHSTRSASPCPCALRQEDPWKAFAAGLKEGDRLQARWSGSSPSARSSELSRSGRA
jgi:small subunit ribosomal protein S1